MSEEEHKQNDNEYMNNKAQCVVCTSSKCDYEMIDNKRICKDYTCWTQPTCRELYTEKYICDVCFKSQNVDEVPCNMFYYETYTQLYKYICDECFISSGLKEPPFPAVAYDKNIPDYTVKINKNWKLINRGDVLDKVYIFYEEHKRDEMDIQI